MRIRVLAFAGIGIVVAGCAAIVGIPDRSLKWCDRPGNTHAFCDDFDHISPGDLWLSPIVTPGATLTYVASDDSPPNALDTMTSALPGPDASALAAFGQTFKQPFDHTVVGVDVKFVQTNFVTQGNLTTGAAFLLLEDQPKAGPGFCIGLVTAPNSGNLPGFVNLGVVYVPNSAFCTSVGNLQADAGADTDGGAITPTIVTQAPVGVWTHLKLEATRAGDGSGIVSVAAAAGAHSAPPIPAGSLGEGEPLVGLATTVTGPSGVFEIQFDNVTVDFPP
jgi:hypothetical protein